jgi:hypothetical protein
MVEMVQTAEMKKGGRNLLFKFELSKINLFCGGEWQNGASTSHFFPFNDAST